MYISGILTGILSATLQQQITYNISVKNWFCTMPLIQNRSLLSRQLYFSEFSNKAKMCPKIALSSLNAYISELNFNGRYHNKCYLFHPKLIHQAYKGERLQLLFACLLFL